MRDMLLDFHHPSMTLIAALLVTVLIPGLSSLLNVWHNNVAGFLTVALSFADGFFAEWAKVGDGYDWKQALGTALVAYALAALARVQLWQGTKVDSTLQAVGTASPPA